MIPEGIDSLAWMQQLAGRADTLSDRKEIEDALDGLEYLMDALDPELQEPAYQLVDLLSDRLRKLSG